ncbi:hypothetical protein COR50_16520 [Chitinophaga caeni]|uniref:VIT family protein n=1 Tax=Chitinophaga caeni TaxID=2029983 RepID=A0A291QXI1_9BACT|nr:VIT1/CCC1 transporter family protein [Chitinophaga caeni]ATL48637.1 hypothetical protein COR50_16520 [Chitinophaga caeni]
MTSRPRKAIRSSGWKTDFFIGFPDGLLLFLFLTQLLHGKELTVQSFYNINLTFLLIATIIIAIAMYRANKGSEDDGLLTTGEKEKLENLDINNQTIDHIASEMQKDEQKWQQVLVDERVTLADYSLWHALRSAFFTGIFFMAGGLVPMAPYFMDENFNSASSYSIILCVVAITWFAFTKSSLTKSKIIPILARNIFIGALVLFASYALSLAF